MKRRKRDAEERVRASGKKRKRKDARSPSSPRDSSLSPAEKRRAEKERKDGERRGVLDSLKRRRGRQPLWTDEEREELVKEICYRIARGEALTRVCSGPGMPHATTFLSWCRDDVLFDKQYARAMEERMTLMAHEITEIADDSSGDSMLDSDGYVRVDHEHIQRSKLRIDTRKWLMGKVLPKFADRQRVDNFEFDPKDFSESELEELKNGADPLTIVARRKK